MKPTVLDALIIVLLAIGLFAEREQVVPEASVPAESAPRADLSGVGLSCPLDQEAPSAALERTDGV